MKALEPAARPRTADEVREQRERAAFSLPDGRGRRKLGRTEPVSLKTLPEVKKMMLDMADAEGVTYTDVFEDAIRRRHAALKGER
jgi:hypothetical protein